MVPSSCESPDRLTNPLRRLLEFTRSLYRGDAYDFIVELRVEDVREEGKESQVQ